MTSWVDLVLVVGFAVVLPAVGLYRTPALRAAVERGEPGARARDYRQTILWEWVFALVVIAWWLAAARGLPAIGLGIPWGWRLWLGGGLTLVTAALLLLQAGWVAGNERARAKVAEQFQTVRWYMPHGRHEVRTFYAASMTAGICEEILYRGYLIWYLAQLTSLWVAVPASSVLFGMAHLYLGKAAALRAGLVGLLLAGLYLFTGSLWAPIVLHAAFDLGSARMAAVVPENLIRPVPSAK